MKRKFLSVDLENKIVDSMVFDELMVKEYPKPAVVSFVNPFSYSLIAKEMKLIENVDYWFVDGIVLCHLTNIRRKNKISRASFDLSSVAQKFLAVASSDNLKIAVIGAEKSEINEACVNLVKLFPKLNIVYRKHGYISNQFQEVYSEINSSGANYAIVGMGTPMQEEFSIGCKKNCPSLSLIITCGGFLTQTAIKPDYYHPLIKKLGLRWLQRAYLHKHVRKRLMIDYPYFIVRYLLNR